MAKKTRVLIPACVVLVIFYIILAARVLPKEIQFVPVWTIDTENSSARENLSENSADFSSAIPFKLGQTLGYISKDGILLNKVTFPYKAALSSGFYALYGTSSENIDFFTPDGKNAGTISGTGFPYFAEDKKCLFLPGGSSFAMLNDDGSRSWDFAYSTPVTAFSTSKSGVVAGFADGNVIAFDNDGNKISEYKPGGSTFEVIYGVAISDSGKYTATLSGQENQRFVISEKLSKNSGSNSSIIFYKTMQNELNRQVIVKFSRDEKNVYYASADGVGLVNLKTMNDTMIPVEGRVLSIKESDSGQEVFILSKKDNNYTVSVVQGFGVLAGSFSFDASSSFIEAADGSLFVGRDTKISKIKIERK